MSEDTKALKKYLNSEEVLANFAGVVGERNAGAYIASVMIAATQNPAIAGCTKKSIFITALRAASLRLSVDPSSKQAYLVPFKDQCTLIVGWKGLQDMAVRTGKYRYIQVTKIYVGEEIVNDRKTGEITWTGGPTKPKTTQGWFASFKLMSGFEKQIYMSLEDIHEHAKKYSPGYARKDGAWKKFPEAMERKTVLRRLLMDWGYLDPADSQTLSEIENEDQEFYDEPDMIIEDVKVIDAPKKSALENQIELGFEISENEYYEYAYDVLKFKKSDKDLIVSVAKGCAFDYALAAVELKKQLPPEE